MYLVIIAIEESEEESEEESGDELQLLDDIDTFEHGNADSCGEENLEEVQELDELDELDE